MMKHKLFFLLILSLIVFLTGCIRTNLNIEIEFVNYSDRTLICKGGVIRELSDTVLPEITPWANGIEKTDRIISPHSKHISKAKKSGFEKLAENGLCESYYFFDIDTIINVPWERIRAENMVLKRVDIYSLEELEYKYKCVITYP